MSDPITYYRHEGMNAVEHSESGECGLCHAVAVVDVRPDSDDMERWFGLLSDVLDLDEDDRGHVTETFRRYAAGETATPPIETFGPGDVVRSKMNGYVYTVAENGCCCHEDGRVYVYESTEPFTSEDYERVDGDA